MIEPIGNKDGIPPYGPWRVRVGYDIGTDGTRILIIKGDGDERYAVRITYEPFKLHTLFEGATILESGDAARDGQQSFLQAVMDAAWEYGLRPTGFNDTKESMKATVKHLEDMRAIVFHQTKAPKP